ncbi:hypothetical protein MRX96_010185 [Rhipicephalus microplus]
MLSMEPRVLLCLFLFVAGSLASEAEKAHSRSRRDFGCLKGNLMLCRLRCSRIRPGTKGYCKGDSCICETGIPVQGSAGIMRSRLVRQVRLVVPPVGYPVGAVVPPMGPVHDPLAGPAVTSLAAPPVLPQLGPSVRPPVGAIVSSRRGLVVRPSTVALLGPSSQPVIGPLVPPAMRPPLGTLVSHPPAPAIVPPVGAIIRSQIIPPLGRGLACVMGNPFMCRRNCFMLYPGSTGVCMGFRCRCIGGPFGPGFLPFIRPIIPFGPLMGPMLMG